MYTNTNANLYLITIGYERSFISKMILNKTDFMFVLLCAEYLELGTCRDGR